MPYVNIKITRENGTTPAQKAALIRGVTDLLRDVLSKSPATTFVVIDEVDLDNWGVGGLPVPECRRLQAEASPAVRTPPPSKAPASPQPPRAPTARSSRGT